MATVNLPPGPQGSARARTLLDYSRSPLNAFTSLAREYGDVVQFVGPPMRAVLLNHPDYIEQVQTGHSWNFQPVRVLIQRRLAAQGVALSEGYLHQHHRRMLDPVYRAEHAARQTDVIVRCVEQMLDRRQDGQRIDIQQEMSELAIRMLTGMLFGADVWQDGREIAAWIKVGDYVARRSTMPWGVIPEYVPLLPANRRFWKALGVLKASVRLRIAERRVTGSARDDVLSLLLSARDPDDGSALTDRQVLDDAVTTVFAGASPIGQSLVWTLYLLSQHPAAEATMYAELDDVLGGRSPVAGDLPHLRYTRMVIDESLRLYPSSWILGRKVLNDYAVDRYVIPAGSIVVLCPYVTQRDERFFVDPSSFVPERWTPEQQASRPVYSYFPFSAGPNRCLGYEWAPTLLTLALATLCRSWRTTLEPGQQVELAPLFVLRAKDGIRMRNERRTTTAVNDEMQRDPSSAPVISKR